MYSMVMTAANRGLESVCIQVEADVSDGLPVFDMVGFLSSEVREARERVRTALHNCGYRVPAKRITVNLSPADVKKSGSGFDLPVAVAILAALGEIKKEMLNNTLVLGEISLNGRIQPIRGILPTVAKAKETGIKRCLLPCANKAEAELIPDMEIWAVEPENAAILAGGTIGTHLQMGIGDGVIPQILNQQIYEDIYIVTDEEAIQTAKDLARFEGIMCGISSGTNVAAALKMAQKLGAGKTVVTVLPDTAERYFSTPLFE